VPLEEVPKTGDELVFNSSLFACDPILRAGHEPECIEYRDDLSNNISGPFLFWGPYVTLGPGTYLIWINGKLSGNLTLELACERGEMILKECTISDLNSPICLVLTSIAKDLELRAIKSDMTQLFTLESVSIRCAYAPPAQTAS
jgi:hypothetical protein